MIPQGPNSRQTLVLGTRGSVLALVQTELAAARFRAVFPDWDVEARVITTEGDLDKQSPLTAIGGRGVFTSALEAALVSGQIDAAVHSAKDLPTSLHPDAPLVAHPDRADPRDVLVSRHGTTLDRLPIAPVIATSSRRRAVQIARLRPDARIVDLRGNVDTRLRKAAEDELDAIVLAAAGLHRLGWEDRIAQYFAFEEMTPSPAQGALAIQARRGGEVATMLEKIDDPDVSVPVSIERTFLGAIGAGCTFPVGAHAAKTADGYRLTAMLSDETGERIFRASELLSRGDERAHAAELAAQLRAEIEPDLRRGPWNGARVADRDLAGVRVVVTRPRRQAGPLADALRARGAETILLPTIRIENVADTKELDARLREAANGAFDWLVFTSANAVEVSAERLSILGMQNGRFGSVRVAAVGKATTAAAEAAGLRVRLVPETSTADDLAAVMLRSAESNGRVLYPRSAIGRDDLPYSLRAAGMDVVTVEVYQTLPEREIDCGVLEKVRVGAIDLITFSSPSTVRNLLDLLGPDGSVVTGVPVVCAGSVTGQAAKDAGFTVVACADDAGAEAMADAVSELWRTRATVGESPSESHLTGAAAGARAMGRSRE